MFIFDTLLPIALAFFIVAVSPGPANIAVSMVAMRYGRRESLLFGTGLSVGLAFWGVIAATGMGAILQSSMYLLSALKILGGLYLLWLAIQSIRTAMNADNETAPVIRRKNMFLKGLLLNLSNPKAVFAWLAALSMGLGGGDDYGLLALATILCMVLGFFNYALHALTFSLPGFMAGYQRFQRWINSVTAGLFALAGFGLIRSAFNR